MGILGRLAASLFGRPVPIADRAALADFIDSRAAFLCQKCVVEFCRVRAGAHWQKLFGEQEFVEALGRAAWQAYPPAVGMLVEMIEGVLRDHAGPRQGRLPAALMEVVDAVLARHPIPPGLGDDFRERARVLVARRLDALQGAPVRPVRKIPDPLARLVFDALPIHRNIVAGDYDYIFNNLRMNLLRFHSDFEDAADGPALADDLLGRE